MLLLVTLSKSLYLVTGHRKSNKIQQIQSKSIKLELLDEIFGEMTKKINCTETGYVFSDLKRFIDTFIQLCLYIKLKSVSRRRVTVEL